MTDDQIKAECEKRFQNGGPRVFYFYPDTAEFFGESASGKTACHAVEKGGQVWQRRKIFGVQCWHWIRLQTAWEKREVIRTPTDTQMLEWMCRDGRYISHDREGEYCNVWHDNPDTEATHPREPVEGYPQKGYRTPREAIIAAMKVQP